RDADDLDSLVGETGLVNVLLHGRPHDARVHRTRSGLLVLATGRAAGSLYGGPREAPTQYELITIRPDGLTRHARAYDPGQRRWVADTRIHPTGSDWQADEPEVFANVYATFADAPDEGAGPEAENADPEAQGSAGTAGEATGYEGAAVDDSILDR